MILVTTGTYGFPKLIKTIDGLVENRPIDKEILAQISGSKYISKHMKYFKYSSDTLRDMAEAEFVISHGGAGTIMELLMLKKKIIAVSNKDLADNHQYPLLKKLSDKKCLLFCPEPSVPLLTEAIASVDEFSPAEFSFYPEKLIEQIQSDLSWK